MNSYQNHRGSSYLSTDPLISSQNIPNEVVHHVQRSQDLLGSTFWSLTWYHQFIKWGLYQKYGTFAKMQDFEMKTLLFERAFRFAGHLGYRYIYIYIHCHIYIYMSIHVYNTCVLCIYTYLHMWAYQQWLQQRFRACARTEKATSRCHCAQATCFIISSMSWRDTLCDATDGILSCSSNCFVGIPSTKCYLHSIWPPDWATLATWISSRNQRGYSACFFLEHAKPSYKSPSSSPSLRASFSSLPRSSWKELEVIIL